MFLKADMPSIVAKTHEAWAASVVLRVTSNDYKTAHARVMALIHAPVVNLGDLIRVPDAVDVSDITNATIVYSNYETDDHEIRAGLTVIGDIRQMKHNHLLKPLRKEFGALAVNSSFVSWFPISQGPTEVAKDYILHAADAVTLKKTVAVDGGTAPLMVVTLSNPSAVVWSTEGVKMTTFHADGQLETPALDAAFKNAHLQITDDGMVLAGHLTGAMIGADPAPFTITTNSAHQGQDTTGLSPPSALARYMNDAVVAVNSLEQDGDLKHMQNVDNDASAAKARNLLEMCKEAGAKLAGLRTSALVSTVEISGMKEKVAYLCNSTTPTRLSRLLLQYDAQAVRHAANPVDDIVAEEAAEADLSTGHNVLKPLEPPSLGNPQEPPQVMQGMTPEQAKVLNAPPAGHQESEAPRDLGGEVEAGVPGDLANKATNSRFFGKKGAIRWDGEAPDYADPIVQTDEKHGIENPKMARFDTEKVGTTYVAP